MFSVFLHNSTTTPSQPGYGQLVRAALADVQADEFMAGHYRLKDETEILFVEDTGDDISMVEFPVLTPAVSEAIFHMASRTGSLILLSGSVAYRTAGNPGEPPGGLALGFDGGLGEVASAQDLDDILAELPEDGPEPEPFRTEAKPPRSLEEPTFFQRLVDTIFGSAR